MTRQALTTVTGILIAFVLSTGLAALTIRPPRSRLITAVAVAVPIVLAATITAGLVTRPPVHQPPPGAITIESGGGDTGCVVDVSGTANIPRGRAAWLFLANERGNYYAQGGRPIVQGPAPQTHWVFPRARVANEFFKNAHYTWLAVVVPQSTSERLQRDAGGNGDAGWVMNADQFPAREEISAQTSATVLLSDDTNCGNER